MQKSALTKFRKNLTQQSCCGRKQKIIFFFTLIYFLIRLKALSLCNKTVNETCKQ